MNHVRVWCEWDIGNQNIVFKSAEVANAWIRANSSIEEMAGEAETSVDDYVESLIDEGLIGTTKVQLIE